MRRRYLFWTITVLGIVATVYGAFMLAYHFNHGNGLKVSALLVLILGILCLAIVLGSRLFGFLLDKQNQNEQPLGIKEDEPEPIEEPKPEPKPEPKVNPAPRRNYDVEYTPRSERPNRSYYDSSAPTIYVKQVGHGPVLRFEGNRILDMRNHTYYRIENHMVNQDGSGPVFEIRGNQIRSAFGGYLYEYSGGNISKIYGGFFASVSGNYITLYDASAKFETTGSLSSSQILVAAALLFGNY